MACKEIPEIRARGRLSQYPLWKPILTTFILVLSTITEQTKGYVFELKGGNYLINTNSIENSPSTTVDMGASYGSLIYIATIYPYNDNAGYYGMNAFNRDGSIWRKVTPSNFNYGYYRSILASMNDWVVQGSILDYTNFWRVTVATTTPFQFTIANYYAVDFSPTYGVTPERGYNLTGSNLIYIFASGFYYGTIDVSTRTLSSMGYRARGGIAQNLDYVISTDYLSYISDSYMTVMARSNYADITSLNYYTTFTSTYIRSAIVDHYRPHYHMGIGNDKTQKIDAEVLDSYDRGYAILVTVVSSSTTVILNLSPFNLLVFSSYYVAYNMRLARKNDHVQLAIFPSIHSTNLRGLSGMEHVKFSDNRDYDYLYFHRQSKESTNQVTQAYAIKVPTCAARSTSTNLCTACPNDGIVFLKSATEGRCSPIEDIPAGFGRDVATSLVAACADPNCFDCSADHSICEECKTAYYLQGSNCYQDLATFPAGYGKDNYYKAVDKVLVPCTTLNCANCSASCRTCTRCNSGYGLTSGGLCSLLSTLADGAGGYNKANFKIEPCTNIYCVQCRFDISVCTKCNYASSTIVLWQDDCISYTTLSTGYGRYSNGTHWIGQKCTDKNCANCLSSVTSCVQCQTTTPQTYLYGSLCYYPSQLPNQYGADLVTKITQLCSDTNCLKCQADYTKCEACKTGLSPARYLYNQACLLSTSLPLGWGGDSSTLTAKVCSKPGCESCYSNFQYCDKCLATLSPRQYAYGGSCNSAFSLGAYYGANNATSIATVCSDFYCYYCRESYTVCTQCHPGYSPTRYLHAGVCSLSTSLPNGFGANSVTREATPCLNPYCRKCQSDYATGCTECIGGTSPQHYFYVNDCVLPETLPAGTGANLVTYFAVACQQTVCAKCKMNYQVCTECDNSGPTKYYLLSGICYTSSALPDGYGAHSSYVAQPCFNSRCNKCNTDYTVCTRCKNTPTMYYFHALNSSCLAVNEIPNGYGAAVVSGYGETRTCIIPSCYACQLDYSVCGECAPNNPPKWVYSNVCTLETSLPNGYGGDIVSKQAIPCTDTNCLQCQSNYNNCTVCKTQTPALYLYQPNGTCLVATSLPDGYGANSVTKLATPCTIVNCTDCRVDYTICYTCNSTGLYPNFLLNNECYQPMNIPLGYGADYSSFRGFPCSNFKCRNCSLNFTDCTQCNFQTPELFLHTLTNPNSCLMSSEMPSGYGPVLDTYSTRPCQEPSCTQCRVSFSTCTSCDLSVTPYLYFHIGSCKQAADLPNPFGANILSRVATRCSDPNCLMCKLDYNVCQDCSKVEPETFLQTSTGKCLKAESAPEGWGANRDTYQLTTCLDPNCKTCQDDYRVCKTCKFDTAPWYVYNGACLRIQSFPLVHGCDNSTYTAKPCTSIGCKHCLLNFEECTQCVDPPESPTLANPKYYLIEKFCSPCNQAPFRVIDRKCHRICDDSKCLISLKATKYLKTKKQLRGEFSQSISLNTNIKYRLRLYSERSNIDRDLQRHEYDISIVNDLMLINLALEVEEFNGAIMFDRVDKEENPIRGDDNSLAFFDYPVRWDAVYYLSSNAEKALSGASGTTAASTASAKAIAQLIIITQNSNIAKIPDMMVSNMIYLRLMNGETYLYPQIVFNFFANSQLPFMEMSNPFSPSLRSPECLVAPKMFEAEMDCGILPNYGTDIIFLYATLAINILVSLIHYGLYGAKLKLHKRHKDTEIVEKIEKSWCFKVSNFINESYGMKMTLVKLDGTVVEVLFFSALTVSSNSISSTKYFYSYLVATLFISYYFWSLYYYVRLILYISPGLEKIRQSEAERKKLNVGGFRPKRFVDYIDFTRVKYGIVGYQIEDYRADLPYVYMFAPLIWFLRCIAINIFLIGGTNMKSGQYYAYVLVESAYLYYLVKSQVKASRFENWLSYFNEGSQIVYLLIQAISYHSNDVGFKQKTAGLSQAAILSAIMVLNIGYTFAILIWQVMIQPIRRCVCKRHLLLSEDKLTTKMKSEDLNPNANIDSQAALDDKKVPKLVVSTFRSILNHKFGTQKNQRPEPLSVRKDSNIGIT